MKWRFAQRESRVLPQYRSPCEAGFSEAALSKPRHSRIVNVLSTV